MRTITLNPSSVKASSGSQYTHVSSIPDAHTTPSQQAFTQPPIFVSIGGHLSVRKWLTHPIVVKIEDDEGEFVVSELKYHMHGEGSTIPVAIDAFKRIFSGYLDILSEEEDNLSSYMYQQLEYLRSAIRSE